MILLVLVAAFIGSDVSAYTSGSFKPVQVRQSMMTPDCRSVFEFTASFAGPYAFIKFPFDGNLEQVIRVKAQFQLPSDVTPEPLKLLLETGGLLNTYLVLPTFCAPAGTEIDINGKPFCRNYEPPPSKEPHLTLRTLDHTFRFHVEI